MALKGVELFEAQKMDNTAQQSKKIQWKENNNQFTPAGVGTRPWWLALFAGGGAYRPLALEASAMTSRHLHCRRHPPAWGKGGGCRGGGGLQGLEISRRGAVRAAGVCFTRVHLTLSHRGRFAHCARAVHKVCTRTYPTYIAVFSTNDN